MPQLEEEVTAVVFPYFKDGEFVNAKFRDGAKNFRQIAGAEKLFFKFDDISPTTIIVEGEMDALSIEVAGFQNCVSVPDGAPAATAKNFDTKFEYLDNDKVRAVEKWIIAVDSDEPGRRLEDELSRRLGRAKCFRVTWPEDCKDANEVLIKHGKEVLRACIDAAHPYPVEGVFSVRDIEDELRDLIDFGLPQGEPTGWKCVDDLYAPCPAQWSLITGIPSMGKSEWLDALAVNLASNSGWVFGVCSPENQPISWHSAKLIEKRMGKRLVPGKFTQDEFNSAKNWLADRFHFILPEIPTLDSVLESARELVRRHGMRGLIIDPYNELDHTSRKEGVAETEYVSLFLSQLRRFAREESVHVWLVAHPAKLMKQNDGKYPVPDGYSISGSAHFYNKADNIIAVHRDTSTPGASTEVHVQKVRSRWLGRRGVANLWWQPDSGRFTENAPINPMKHYFPKDYEEDHENP
jgi:twinkle protein